MIILMGVAGAGKSVQGKLLAKDSGAEWVSTGELLRSSISDERREDMLQGKLLADQEIIAVVSKFFEDHGAQNCILDGFPRTIPQAEWLLADERINDVIHAIIHLTADREVVKKRLLSRGRPDDNGTAIDLRFKEYESKTLPIVALFENHGIKVHEINGEQDIEDVHKDIMEKLNKR